MLIENNKNAETAKEIIKSIYKSKAYDFNEEKISHLPEWKEIKAQSEIERKQLLLNLLSYLELSFGLINTSTSDYERKVAFIIMQGLLKQNLKYRENEWIILIEKVLITYDKLQISGLVYKGKKHQIIANFPYLLAIKQLERITKSQALQKKTIEFIEKLIKWELWRHAGLDCYYGIDLRSPHKRLKNLLANQNREKYRFELKTEDIGRQVNEILLGYSFYDNSDLHALLALADTAKGSKPTNKFLMTMQNYINNLGRKKIRTVIHDILNIAIVRSLNIERYEKRYGRQIYTHTKFNYLNEESIQFMKGVVWLSALFSDMKTSQLIGNLLEKCFTKIEDHGAVSTALGNACIYSLGNMRGKEGLSVLSRAKLKVKQNNTKKLIDKQLDAGAKKYGVSVDELAEMAVPDFGLCV